MDVTNMNGSQQPPTAQRFGIRRVFLISMIASLSISALIAIFIFLFGSSGKTEFKLLLTTLIVGGYSLICLCSSVLYERKRYLPLAFSGVIVSVIGFLITVGVIWDILDYDHVWVAKSLLIFTILAVSIVHSTLLLFIRSDKKIVNISLAITISFITIVALMLIIMVLTQRVDFIELFYRLLGVFAVLDVLGTIVTPILKKFNS